MVAAGPAASNGLGGPADTNHLWAASGHLLDFDAGAQKQREFGETARLDMHHSPLAITSALRAAASPPGHQFQSPAIRRSAGPITMRTSVASINTATASVNPSILTTRKFPKVNAANTTIMIAAAFVIRPAVLANPSGIASISLSPLLLASRTRATKNTS